MIEPLTYKTLTFILAQIVFVGLVKLITDKSCYYCRGKLDKPLVKLDGKWHCGCEIKNKESV